MDQPVAACLPAAHPARSHPRGDSRAARTSLSLAVAALVALSLASGCGSDSGTAARADAGSRRPLDGGGEAELGAQDGSVAADAAADLPPSLPDAQPDGAADSGAADPYAHWPAEGTVYPWVYTPEPDLQDYERVRWETETWDPDTDAESAALYVRKLMLHRPGAPEESLAHFRQQRAGLPALGSGVRLSLVGDMLPPGDSWAEFAMPCAHLLDGDLRIGNLETPTSPLHPTDRSEMGLYEFNAPPEMLDGLPLDVLQLNNNHSLDCGDEGLEATLSEVAQRGLTQVGVDQQASVAVGERTVALLAYTWGVNRRDIASTHELHIVPFGHVDEPIDLTLVRTQVSAARESADSVVVLLHWGFEYEYYPDPHFMVLARDIVAGGADVIVGQGPHVVQPAEICHVNQPERVPGVGTCSVRSADGRSRTAAVLYSLGNFSTPQPGLPLRAGIVATVSLDPDVTGLGWAATLMTRGADVAVIPLSEALDDPEVLAESRRLGAHLGTGWRRD